MNVPMKSVLALLEHFACKADYKSLLAGKTGKNNTNWI